MNTITLIAKEEWRYWQRSSLATSAAILFMLLLITTIAVTMARMANERHERQHHQESAEETFLEQPDRHPHRMVHYGHYAFRTPSPLSIFDPGVDPVTGQTMFLEGHRQNSAMFADSGASADLGGLSLLTPAVVYQLFAPLLVLLLGHGAIVREREASTLTPMLAQGISGAALIGGKALALLWAIGLMLIPLALSTIIATGMGESLFTGLSLLAVYLVYLSIWGLLSLAASALLTRRSLVLASLTACWLAFTLLLPSLAASNAARTFPIAGKIETDLVMLADLRKLGDGHNANDPAFEKLRGDLLEEYGAESIDELPVNFRGIVAGYSEAKLTDTMNAYAEERMQAEAQQARILASHGWLTPMLAIASASRTLAATDLGNHQRFLLAAEALRFDFVQGLNTVHAEELSYSDDINRGNDEASSRRARVAASNWEVLEDFRFEPEGLNARLGAAASSLLALLAWFVALSMGTLWAGQRIRP